MIWITEKDWETAGRMALMGRFAAGRGLEAVSRRTRPTPWRPNCSRLVRGDGATCLGW